MTPLEYLYYAVGELAYTMASADGSVQPEERKKFLQILNEELDEGDGMPKVGEIIFTLMEKRGGIDAEATYEMAMNTIRTNSHYLSPQLKQRFIHLLERVAGAHPPVTTEESALLKRFREDIRPINGDPVFYSVH